jgi:hypothetical protein
MAAALAAGNFTKKVINYIFWLKASQRAFSWVKIKFYKFPAAKAAAILTKEVMLQLSTR